MFSSGEASTLDRALSSVRRRARLGRAAAGALLGAAIAAGPAYLLRLPSLAALAAAAVALVAMRRRLPPPAAWLDASDRDDLVLTATAVIDHRARATALAGSVVTAAASRASRVRPPALAPAALAFAATAALVLLLVVAVRIPDTAPVRRAPVPSDTERVHGTRPAGASADATDGSDAAGAERVHGTRTAGASGEAADGAEAEVEVLRTFLSAPDGKGGHGDGPGEGAGAALRGAAEGDATAARASSELAISAPVAGASAEVAAVPARYRGVVAAYLEAR